jgi:hypothetical protein
LDSMTPTEIDKLRSETNPWSLTSHQCMTIRLVCLHGGTKRASHAEDLPLRTLEHHLLKSRKAMQMYGSDVRLFIEFDRWVRPPVQASKRSSRPALLQSSPVS